MTSAAQLGFLEECLLLRGVGRGFSIGVRARLHPAGHFDEGPFRVVQFDLADRMTEITGHPLPLDVPLHIEFTANRAGWIVAAQAEPRRRSVRLEKGL